MFLSSEEFKIFLLIVEMSYDLNGRKILICVNVVKYGSGRDRKGSEKDEKSIINTFQDRIKLKRKPKCLRRFETQI